MRRILAYTDGLRSQKLTICSEDTTESKADEMPKGKQGVKLSDQEQNHLGSDKDMNMVKLMSYIKESQEKSEKALMGAIEGSKREINENMESMAATLIQSVVKVRADLTKAEQTFDSKIKKLQENIDSVNSELKNAADKIESGNHSAKNENDTNP